MQAQTKKIQVPKNLTGDIQVVATEILPNQRIYRESILINLLIGHDQYQVRSPFHGWVKAIHVKQGQFVAPGELLCTLSVFDSEDYQPDDNEVSLHTELGDAGRRGLERQGQRPFGNGFDKELFDAPQDKQGMGINPVKQHPLLAKSKPGVPPKMNSSSSENTPAVEKLAEDSQNSPELQAKLSNELKQELGIQPGPSVAPTLTQKR